MAESNADIADKSAAEETASAPGETERRSNNGEIPAEKIGDEWRASPNGSGDFAHLPSLNARDASPREFLEMVKAHHQAEKERRERERRESGDLNANLTADLISEMRNERDEQILSALLGIYEEDD